MSCPNLDGSPFLVDGVRRGTRGVGVVVFVTFTGVGSHQGGSDQAMVGFTGAGSHAPAADQAMPTFTGAGGSEGMLGEGGFDAFTGVGSTSGVGSVIV